MSGLDKGPACPFLPSAQLDPYREAGWSFLEEYGIQRCSIGVQVYAQPRTPEQIHALGQTLINVANKLKKRKPL